MSHPTNEVHLPSLEPMQRAVGEALSNFGSVEMMLSMIYARIMHPAPSRLSFLTLDAARHIETKCRIARTVAAEVLEGDDLVRFNNVLNRIKRRTEVRHKLAHWIVGFWHPKGTLTKAEDWIGTEVRLIPVPLSAGKLFAPSGSTLTLDEVTTFSRSCQRLTVDMAKVFDRDGAGTDKPANIVGGGVTE